MGLRVLKCITMLKTTVLAVMLEVSAGDLVAAVVYTLYSQDKVGRRWQWINAMWRKVMRQKRRSDWRLRDAIWWYNN